MNTIPKLHTWQEIEALVARMRLTHPGGVVAQVNVEGMRHDVLLPETPEELRVPPDVAVSRLYHLVQMKAFLEAAGIKVNSDFLEPDIDLRHAECWRLCACGDFELVALPKPSVPLVEKKLGPGHLVTFFHTTSEMDDKAEPLAAGVPPMRVSVQSVEVENDDLEAAVRNMMAERYRAAVGIGEFVTSPDALHYLLRAVPCSYRDHGLVQPDRLERGLKTKREIERGTTTVPNDAAGGMEALLRAVVALEPFFSTPSPTVSEDAVVMYMTLPVLRELHRAASAVVAHYRTQLVEADLPEDGTPVVRDMVPKEG